MDKYFHPTYSAYIVFYVLQYYPDICFHYLITNGMFQKEIISSMIDTYKNKTFKLLLSIIFEHNTLTLIELNFNNL